MLDGAREAVADLLGASPREVALGANMTTLTFHLSRGIGRAWGAPVTGSATHATSCDRASELALYHSLLGSEFASLCLNHANGG
jgi:hypothetical protein